MVPVLTVQGLNVGYTLGRPVMDGNSVRSLIGMGKGFYPVLRDMSFCLTFPTKMSTVLGPNGAGKTTLLRALAGVVPCSGVVNWCGEVLNDLSSYERTEQGITFVPHSGGIFPSLTASEHFQLAIGQRFSPKTVIEELYTRVRDKGVGLESKLSFLNLDTRAGNLSGGEQKILSLLRLLFRRWSLVLLDEPTAGLSKELLEVYGVILDMLVPACVLNVEQYSRAILAKRFGSILYELRDGSLQASGV